MTGTVSLTFYPAVTMALVSTEIQDHRRTSCTLKTVDESG